MDHPVTAVYDACVLYPAPLRSLLMYLALTDLFRARWTDAIHEECRIPGERSMRASTYNFVRNHSTGLRTITMSLKSGRIQFALQTLGTFHLPEGVEPYSAHHHPSQEFGDLIGQIRVTVTAAENDSQVSAEFSGEEVVAMLGDRWPDEQNFDHLHRSVVDRRCYPLNETLPPSERSFTAQGQTKKPGSHSGDRHH